VLAFTAGFSYDFKHEKEHARFHTIWMSHSVKDRTRSGTQGITHLSTKPEEYIFSQSVIHVY
jgi:hypothetical protein